MQDQYGIRFIQQKLENATAGDREKIFLYKHNNLEPSPPDSPNPNKKLSTCVTISTSSHPNSLISDHDKFKIKALHMQV
jgi:hypothetical protein